MQAEGITEICEIDGLTYIAVPDGIKVEVPIAIKDLKEAVISPDLVTQIKLESPHIRLINKRVNEQIREKYPLEEELQILRCRGKDASANAEFAIYDSYVETCRAWGKGEREKLGL